jgi:hypothetical protein
MIRARGGEDVYIIKYNNGKRFKRLILSPSVFKSYGHLKWEDIIAVDPAVLDCYATSSHVRVTGDSRIWELRSTGGDTGRKALVVSGYDPDSVYEINLTDLNSYSS